MKLRSGRVLRRLRSSPKINPQENVVVEEMQTGVSFVAPSQPVRRRSPRNTTTSYSTTTSSSSTHSMRLRSRK